MAGGVAAVTGAGRTRRFTFANTWSTGDTFQVSLTDSLTGNVVVIGDGLLGGLSLNYVFTHAKKVYLLSGTAIYFSEVDSGTSFNDPNGTGNGYIDMSNSSGTLGTLMAVSNYQGKLAVIGRNVTQILAVDPDPANYAVTQTLDNIGTVAGESVKSVGDLDTYMLSDSGFRSLRVRDASSNATKTDIGTPIDSAVQAVLIGLDDAQKAAACAVVEPNTDRYWCYLNGTIYVFSNFRESGVAAWSNYTPEYYPGGVQTAFTPTKFEVLNGRVYVRAGDNIYLYGGTKGVTYDESVCAWATYYMDGKNPSAHKMSHAIDAAFTGAWSVSLGMDPASGTLDTVYANNEATYWLGRIPAQQQGTHMKIAGQTTGATAATFDSLTVLFSQAEVS